MFFVAQNVSSKGLLMKLKGERGEYRSLVLLLVPTIMLVCGKIWKHKHTSKSNTYHLCGSDHWFVLQLMTHWWGTPTNNLSFLLLGYLPKMEKPFTTWFTIKRNKIRYTMKYNNKKWLQDWSFSLDSYLLLAFYLFWMI